MKAKDFYFLLFTFYFLLSACKTVKPVVQQQQVTEPTTIETKTQFQPQNIPALLNDSIFNNAHVGIYIYEPATKKSVEEYQSNKYFIPASNTKIATCYAAMKYLGDSLLGLMYDDSSKDSIKCFSTGDPTFLHPQFTRQPVYSFLSKQKNKTSVFYFPRFKKNDSKDIFYTYGMGWAWDDYNENYMAERSDFPIYGNVIRFKIIDSAINIEPSFFKKNCSFTNKKISGFDVIRNKDENKFSLNKIPKYQHQEVPFLREQEKETLLPTPIQLLNDTLNQDIEYSYKNFIAPKNLNKIYSQPTDSLLKPMMHNSDNFFAEQTLLMISLNQLGFLGDEQIIDTLIKTIYKDLPQKPRWVDGSGLSRYNLFTPQDFVFILNKMKTDFSWQRISTIFPTANQGTLKGYYKNFSNKIFAKTGSVSNNYAISGFIKTNSGKDFIFSVMVNNYNNSNSSAVRGSIEKYLSEVIEKK